MTHQLDHIDKEIIKILQENARTPLKVIADQVFLSSPAVSSRIEVVFHTTMELDTFIGQLQHFGKTQTQIVFSTSVEHRGIQLTGM